MLKIQNVILSLGILTISIFIGLFSTDRLQWKTAFGLPDVVNIVVALLTFGAVYISYKASKSAERSAALSEVQTNLLANQYEYELSPALVPFGNEFVQDSKSIIYHSFNSKLPEHTLTHGTMTYSLKNVGKGAAYYLSVWIEIDNLGDIYEKDVTYTDVDDSPFNHYEMVYSLSEDGEETLDIRDSERESSSLLINYPQRIEIIEPGETIELLIPNHVQTIILDSSGRHFERNEPMPAYTFHCVYKSILQIQSEEYSKIEYDFFTSSFSKNFDPKFQKGKFKLKTEFSPKIIESIET